VSDQALVLAAGKGTRMRSSLPKVLHLIAGKPMLVRVLDTLAEAGFTRPAVVVGYGAERIEEEVGPRCRYVPQPQQLGTGDAARVGVEAMPDARRVLVVHGDEPMIPAETYREMLDRQTETGAAVVLLTTNAQDLRGFGRVVRDRTGAAISLTQEGDLTPEQRSITEVNLGAYVFDAGFLRRSLTGLAPHPPKGEYYLTDLVAAAVTAGGRVEVVEVAGGEEIMGVNDLIHLEKATQVIYRRINRRHMASGVTIVDSASTFIGDDVQIETETVIHPFTTISGTSTIGKRSEIGPGAVITSACIGERCRVVSSTVSDSSLGDDVHVGPYAHIRGGASLGQGVYVGTHAEIKGSTLGEGTRMHHFSYLGDAEVGAGVNIGAGTITANYDGVRKNRTVIGDGAFIGSDSILRAPIEIGEGSFTGAGSVVTKDVPPGTMVVGIPARRVIRGSEQSEETSREERHGGS
jgi:bifunctional UDP-N-acetylglucosamine pyrophosphorylase/glucosamine-1-phosphate N-acetyltransferase